jgi:hypothetical protein
MDLRSHILIQPATSERIVRDVLSVGAVTFRICSPRWAYCAGIAIDLCRVTEAMAGIFASPDGSTKTSLSARGSG